MKTYKTAEGFFLNVSDINIGITPKEYTMINNIIDRTLKKYDYQIDKIIGKIQSYCETDKNGCIGCPYHVYCRDVDFAFLQHYYGEEHDKFMMSKYIHKRLGSPQEDILWCNTMEELVHYTEGE